MSGLSLFSGKTNALYPFCWFLGDVQSIILTLKITGVRREKACEGEEGQFIWEEGLLIKGAVLKRLALVTGYIAFHFFVILAKLYDVREQIYIFPPGFMQRGWQLFSF